MKTLVYYASVPATCFHVESMQSELVYKALQDEVDHFLMSYKRLDAGEEAV